MSIQSIASIGNQPTAVVSSAATAAPAKGQFAHLLGQYVQQAQHLGDTAKESAMAIASGKPAALSMSEAVIKMQEADLSMKMMVTARNKLVDAYREVMRMQV